MSRATRNVNATWGPIPNRWAIGVALKLRVIKLRSGQTNRNRKIWYPNSIRNYFLQAFLSICVGFGFAQLVARTGIVDGMFSGDGWKVSNVVILQTTDSWVNILAILVILEFQFFWMLLFWRFIARVHWKFDINFVAFLLVLALCVCMLIWRLSAIPPVEYDLYTKNPTEFIINWVAESFVLFIGVDSLRVIKGQAAKFKTKSKRSFDWTDLLP